MLQERMDIRVYKDGEKFYLEGYTLNALGFSNLVTGELSRLYETTYDNIERMMAEYMQRNPNIELTSTTEELGNTQEKEETTSLGK